MIQKFIIRKNADKKELAIEEYAVINANPSRKGSSAMGYSDYSLLSLQVYELRDVKTAIQKGKTALISELRTPHFFPASFCIDKIANKVMDLFELKGDQSVEVIVDEKHSLSTLQSDGEIAESTKEKNE